jgi:hypothetical protein
MENSNTASNSGENKKAGGVTKWAMVFGIAIVLNLFFNYALSLVYTEPVMDYSQGQVVEQITNKTDCLSVGGQWTDNTGVTPVPTDITNTKPLLAVNGYCDPNYTKQMQYQAAHKIYDRTVFITLVVLGVGLLILGAVLANVILALAFSWGGVLSVVIASARYWSDADKLLKVIILAVALAALIWVAIKKFGK